ncbi:MAG TPA: hypothetical protein VD867_04635 [Burkholderiales bacterium]|nr:hypothetical protein [Burkholderiales bacterium]
MTPIKACVGSLLVLGALAAGGASAHGVRFGFHFGFPVFPSFYYPAPAYYYPPTAYYYPPAVVAAPEPRVYVERNERPVAAPSPEHYWYYCPDSQTYHPYVQQCASAWQRVSPRPPDVR